MPPMSTLRTFIESVQTGQTNTTKALDGVFSNLNRFQNHPHRADFKNAGAFNTLPAWAKAELQGLSSVEFDHIDGWPNPDKDRIRASIDKAIDDGRTKVCFFWAPSDDASEAIEIVDPDKEGDITVKFLSPRSRIKFGAGDEVSVDVGK